MTILEDRLRGFQLHQILKFKQRQDRNEEANVFDPNLDWRKLPWDHIREHFMREIKELLEAPEDEKELIDIANIAFLLWCEKVYGLNPKK